jgi:hypothetical protein
MRSLSGIGSLPLAQHRKSRLNNGLGVQSAIAPQKLLWAVFHKMISYSQAFDNTSKDTGIAKQLEDSTAETAVKGVLLNGDDMAKTLCQGENQFTVQRFHKTRVDNRGVDIVIA